MPIFRNIAQLQQHSFTTNVSVDLTNSDFGMRFGPHGELVKCGANEIPHVIPVTSASAGEKLSAVVVQPCIVTVRISGAVHQGDKIAINSSGAFCGSNTSQSAVFQSQDFAIALQSGNNEKTDIFIVRGA